MSICRSFTVALLGAASIAVLASSPAAAQRASLLVDINATRLEDGPGQVSTFHDLRQVGDKLFFLSNVAAVGSELWVSDGTPAGTEVVRDLCPGRCGSAPVLLDALGPVLLWSADGELWRSDGTRPGTFALTAPGLAVNVSMGHATFHGSLYFVSCAPFVPGEQRDCDLWRTDGSVAGTQLFHDATSSLAWMQVAGERLYFLRNDASGAELFVTDGTEAGTVRLRRFDNVYERPHHAVAAGGRLFFIAWQDGQEVWTSDGTAAGTRPLTSFQPLQPFLFAAWLKPAGNRVYFVADDGAHGDEIWRTDGTAAVRVTDFVDETPFFDRQPSLLVEVGGRLVFEVVAAGSPSPLWTSTGTPSSTAPLAIPCGGCQLDPLSSLVVSGGQAFFIAQTNNDESLWVTDGTAAGTREVSDRCYSCSTEVLQPWNGGVLFPAGSEIWFTDGTVAGTLRFAQLADADPVDYVFNVVGLGGNAYFFADGPDTWGLWVRDAEGKTRPIYSFPVEVPSSAPRRLTAFDDRLLFTAWDGGSANDSLSLWSSGGAPETTVRVPVPSLYWGWAKDFVRVGGLLFFQAGEGNEPHNLWRTDGTAAGTFVVAHLQGEGKLIAYQDALYFFDGGWIWKTDGTVDGTEKTGELPSDLQIEVAAPGANGIYIKGSAPGSGTDFWFTDGTTAGTRQITHLNLSGVTGHPPEFTRFGAHVYFSYEGLWRSDGTEAGTLKLPLEMPRFGYPTKLAVHQGALYFFVATPGFSSPYELRLWRTDGTTFTELASFPGQDTSPVELTPFGDRLYFNVDDGVHGIELWTTDGTPAGTRLVSDVFPGRRSSSPTQLTVAGNRFYFAAGDDLHGIELWESDGTAAGTRLVQDIAPQADSSSPDQLTLAGGNLFFTADDGVSGREVWVLEVGGAAACRPSTTRLCLGGGRYAVEAAWRDFQGHRGSGRAATLTADTGYFWFFDPANVEVILKVLDGRGLNDHVWVFYGALSSVEYTLTVTDTETGLAHRYRNPGGQLASVADTRAFGPLGASAKRGAAAAAPPSPPPIVERRVTSKTTACAASSTRLCLNGGRFAVEVVWKDFAGNTGVGHAAPLTGDTGTFWFFGESNVELVVKVLDGRPLNGRHWLFYGALSSVEYTVTVTDTQTGKVKVYTNPSGRLASVADVDAF